MRFSIKKHSVYTDYQCKQSAFCFSPKVSSFYGRPFSEKNNSLASLMFPVSVCTSTERETVPSSTASTFFTAEEPAGSSSSILLVPGILADILKWTEALTIYCSISLCTPQLTRWADSAHFKLLIIYPNCQKNLNKV